MPSLVEINPGTWVRPDRVTSIVARGEFPAFKEGAKPFKPSVHVALDDRHEQIGWTFDDVEDAKAFAAKLVATVNDALAGLIRTLPDL